MLQILGLRSFEKDGKTITYDAFHDKGWRAISILDLFKNLKQHLNRIPQEEHWNLFYTIANCKDEKRGFLALGALALDIDGIDKTLIPQYVELVAKILELQNSSLSVVSSGNGLHFIIHLKSPIDSRAFYVAQKPSYQALCAKINSEMAQASLPGKADPTIFEPRRLLRLPGTKNIKPGKPETKAELLQIGIEQDFELSKFSPIGCILTKDSQLSSQDLKSLTATDTPAILNGCLFLKWCQANQAKVSEPQWYAALSIVGRLSEHNGKNAKIMADELSREHPSYSPEETERKTEQALKASGPRTCQNINELWDGCSSCKYKNKVASPIQIVGEGKLATELTGFHFIGKGKPVPNHHDLREFFKRKTHFKRVEGSRNIFVWKGTHYKEVGYSDVENFADKKFVPKVKYSVCREFRELVTISDPTPENWFSESTEGCINFKNGFLDTKTKTLYPHSPDRGFLQVLPYNYDPHAKAPNFEKMLRLISEGNESIQQIILEAMGYALSNDKYWLHKAIIFDGEGANGKSTLLELLELLAGEDNFSSCSMKDLESEYSRQMLDGKLFNLSEETPTRALVDSSIFKILTSGGSMQVRAPYKEPYSIRNRAKCIFLCNRMPKGFDTSYGFMRRLLIVPLNATLSKETMGEDYDPHIMEKLTGELPGVFNLCLDAYKRLKTQKDFTKSELVDSAIKQYELEINTVKRWFNEEISLLEGEDSEKFTPISRLYEHYKMSMVDESERPITKDSFSKELAKIIPKYESRYSRRRINGALKRCLSGVAITSELDLEAQERLPKDRADEPYPI